MNNNYKKVMDVLSQIGQLTNLQQYVKIDPITPLQEPEKSQNANNIPEASKYIYIGKEDLVKLFPQLEGKLDITNLIGGLLGNFPIIKDIILQTQETSKPSDENKVENKAETEPETEPKTEDKVETEPKPEDGK